MDGLIYFETRKWNLSVGFWHPSEGDVSEGGVLQMESLRRTLASLRKRCLLPEILIQK